MNCELKVLLDSKEINSKQQAANYGYYKRFIKNIWNKIRSQAKGMPKYVVLSCPIFVNGEQEALQVKSLEYEDSEEGRK